MRRCRQALDLDVLLFECFLALVRRIEFPERVAGLACGFLERISSSTVAGPKRETRLVQEGNDPPALTRPFLMRGQSRFSHASMSASLRSRAWVAGRWGDQSCAWSTRPTDRGWYAIPSSRSTTCAMRASVHRSVSNPAATAPERGVLRAWSIARRRAGRVCQFWGVA
jgi:hypothetical protein